MACRRESRSKKGSRDNEIRPSDAEWRLICPILPCQPSGVPHVDDKPGAQRHLLGRAVGLGFVASSFVKLAVPSRENMETFDKLVHHWPDVVTCERITGAVDYLIKVVTDDIKTYDNFLHPKLLDNTLVSDVQSCIVVNTVKDTVALPLREN